MSETTLSSNDPIVIDLGKRKKSAVKKLRKGRGTLMDKVGDCVIELKTAKEINQDAQIVVIVVKEKSKKGWLL
jgi:hypothetical protein